MQFSDVDWMDTWKALQATVKAGKVGAPLQQLQSEQVRSIGVSNFNAAQMQRLLDAGGDAPCSMLQVGAARTR